ncbi:hypothetical protein Vafri_14324 [Volvox africanus]|uniref:Uncharacterized protein n=1 Tax=Volvox africanus TaxID=51714 RepID=A0A8J4BDA4_9CHLO|nr:hypothetical protein Vafri_14324 [Volvox africanus]
MSTPDDIMTRGEFFKHLASILAQYFDHKLLRSAMGRAILKLDIPDGDDYLEEILLSDLGAAGLQSNVVHGTAARKKAAIDTDKRKSLNAYSVFVCWFSDFAAHYGRHPAIVKLKQDNPTIKLGTSLTSLFYKSIPAKEKEELLRICTDFRSEYKAWVEADSSLTVSEALKKYEAAHPESEITKMVGLEKRPEYITDPAQMRSEAAEARRQANNEKGTAPTTAMNTPAVGEAPTPNPVLKLEFGEGHKQKRPVEEAAATTSRKKHKTTSGDKTSTCLLCVSYNHLSSLTGKPQGG